MIPDECPCCGIELQSQEAEPDVGLFFSGKFCSECDFSINSYDFPLYDDRL